jgi:hypothetical protein
MPKPAETTTSTVSETESSLIEREGWQGILYGDPGIGKSHTFSTFASHERPLCIWLFDAVKKAYPYYNPKHFPNRVLQPDELTDKFGTPYREVKDTQGRLILRLEYYRDAQYDIIESAQRFRDRVVRAQKEHTKGLFWGFVLDSISAAAMKYRMYNVHMEEGGKLNRWEPYGYETDAMEMILLQQLPDLTCTVGVTMHVSKAEDKIEMEGSKVRAPLVRGRVFDNLAHKWPEIYRLYVDQDENKHPVLDKHGAKVRRLMTENDGKWMATSAMGMPDGTRASWAAMVKALK